MNETQIAVNRAAPLFREAASIYEKIQNDLIAHRAMTADILDAAAKCGHALDSGFLAITSSNLEISEADVLEAHAPNIPIEKARKLRAYAQGKYSDPNQRWLFGLEEETESTKAEKRAKAAAWEQAWGYISKLGKVELDGWPKEQVDLTRDELAAAVKRFGGEVKWN